MPRDFNRGSGLSGQKGREESFWWLCQSRRNDDNKSLRDLNERESNSEVRPRRMPPRLSRLSRMTERFSPGRGWGHPMEIDSGS